MKPASSPHGWSLRARSIALLLATLIPLAGLGAYWLAWEAWSVRAQMERRALVTAALVAADSGRLVVAAAKALAVLAVLPEVQAGNRIEMEHLFGHILTNSSHLENILAVTPEGHLLASAVPIRAGAQTSFSRTAA